MRAGGFFERKIWFVQLTPSIAFDNFTGANPTPVFLMVAS
jgi:hypothetical protein